jgi:cell filamentation protein
MYYIPSAKVIGRTNREFIRQLALKNGYILNLKKVNPKETLEASIESIVDTSKLEQVIEECLEKIDK